MKEEVDYDPTKTETLYVRLNINDKKDNQEWAIYGSMPWIIDDVADKVENVLGIGHLNSLYIGFLDCKSWVANELLDLLCSYDLPEQGLDKLSFVFFEPKCEPFEEEVLYRLAHMSPNLTHLELSEMYLLTEAGRLSMVDLLRQIV